MPGNEQKPSWRGRMRYRKPVGAEGDFEPSLRDRRLPT
jgi:hypothetical protein